MADTAVQAEGLLGDNAPGDPPAPPPVDLEEPPGSPREVLGDLGEGTVTPLEQEQGPSPPAPPGPDVDPWHPGTDEIRTDSGDREQFVDPLPPSTESCSVDVVDGGALAPRSPQERGLTGGTDPAGKAVEFQNDPRELASFGPQDRVEGGSDDVEEERPEVDQAPPRGLLERWQGRENSPTSDDSHLPASEGEESHDDERGLLLDSGPPDEAAACPLHVAMGHGLAAASRRLFRTARGRKSQEARGLQSAETDREDLLGLLHYEGGVPAEMGDQSPLARSDGVAGTQETRPAEGAVAENLESPPGASSRGESESGGHRRMGPGDGLFPEETVSSGSGGGTSEADNGATESASDRKSQADLSSFPAFKEVPGPCEADDLLEGVIFGAKYLGSTQLVSERNPPTALRMAQAQEAVDRIKAPEGESQPMTDVDLFISTQRIKVLTAEAQETMMDHPLQTISYIADIGNIVVLMARRRLPRRADAPAEKQLYKMICHVFRSGDAQLIAQAIGQAFSVAYQHFLRASGIDPGQLASRGRGGEDDEEEEEDALASGEDLYNGDLAHFSKQENCQEVVIPKQKGEILGVVIVESGWGSILPTVVIANLMHRGAAERSGKLSIGDRIMSVNGTSLVGLPLATCQSIIRDLKTQTEVTLSVVHCPPVTTAIVRRPDTKYPLGFCVENGIICSLMRGGIAERGGIRVGHRIIEINGQSVVAMAHEKIIQILTQAVSEVHIKTMPASTYRLLTGQEQPVFL